MRVVRAALAAAGLALLTAAPAQAVVGGTPANAGDHPWLASIGTPAFFLRASGQFCGGALVGPDKVVTAAHCVSMYKAIPGVLRVRFGQNDLRDSAPEQVNVKSIWVHPQFRETKFQDESVEHNDIAVITLSRAVQRPTVPLDRQGQPVPATAKVIGWGATSESSDSNTRLRAATVPVASDAACAQAYGASFNAQEMVCAGSAQADTCKYDSGGPLLADGRVIGLTSWALGCARAGYPGAYTRVASYSAALPL